MRKTTICLYLCKKHLVELLLKVEFGKAIDQMLPSHAGTCNYCKAKDVVRIFLYEHHWLVNEWIEEHGKWK